MNPIVIFLFLGSLALSGVTISIMAKRADNILQVVGISTAALLIPAGLTLVWATSTEYQHIEGTVVDVRPSVAYDSLDSMLIKRTDGQGQIISQVDRGSDHPDAGDQVVVVTNQLGLTNRVEALQK